MKKFVLCVEYGTGKASMLTESPDLLQALQEFVEEHKKVFPDTKMYGMPFIQKAELYPLMYRKEENNGETIIH
jgi:hypothetical protein